MDEEEDGRDLMGMGGGVGEAIVGELGTRRGGGLFFFLSRTQW